MKTIHGTDRHLRQVQQALIIAACGVIATSALGQCPGMEPVFIWSSVGTTIRFVNVTETWGAPVDSLHWEFGDGASETDNNDTAYHTYGFTFVDTVRMALWSQGCQFLVVAPVAHGDANDDCSLDIAPDFIATPLGNNSVSFANISFTDGVDFSSAWTFGDGSLSLDPSTDHLYIFPGAYNVALNLAGEDTSTSDGCVAGRVQRLFVDGNSSTCDTSLFVDFNYSFDGSFAQFEAVIVPLSPDLDTTGFNWSLGDASLAIANEQSPYHVYAYPGSYQVCLTVTAVQVGDSLDLCSAVVCHTLEPTLTSVNEPEDRGGFLVFPNPSTTSFTINDARLNGEGRIELFDIGGHLLESRQLRAQGRIELDGSNLAPGAYVIRATFDRGSGFATLLKQ